MTVVLPRLALFLMSVYVLLWGATWITADQSYGISVSGPSGGQQLYPGALFGGLPPIAPAVSDAPPYLAAALGFAGIVWIAVDFSRRLANR